MKLKWLIVNIITAVGPPTRAESELHFFWPIWAPFVVKKPLCDLKTPFRALNNT